MEVCSKMSSMLAGGARDEFKETELRLGLPGGGCGGGEGEIAKNSGKRGFSETIDLKLELTSKDSETKTSPEMTDNPAEDKSILPATNDPARPPAAKAQVVGWPPVRSFRKNILVVQKSNTSTGTDQEEKKMNNVNNTNNNTASTGGLAFVKVSMDGAPYLRKVDLKMHKSYQELSDALGKMFSSFTIGNCGSEGMLDFMNESKLMDILNDSEYLPSYEDKDGDWMLVGDVPWEMFVNSCKRLRIMKGSDAIGLAPRAVEKCRNRS